MKNIEVYNNLDAIKKEKEYTRMKLSEITKLSQQYISRVENGIIVPSIGKAITITEAL